jgi:hypothetical protein
MNKTANVPFCSKWWKPVQTERGKQPSQTAAKTPLTRRLQQPLAFNEKPVHIDPVGASPRAVGDVLATPF